MSYSPKNRLSAGEILKSDHFCENGKMKSLKESYPCQNYIEAMTVKETLKAITGKEYNIEDNGAAGWTVVVMS